MPTNFAPHLEKLQTLEQQAQQAALARQSEVEGQGILGRLKDRFSETPGEVLEKQAARNLEKEQERVRELLVAEVDRLTRERANGDFRTLRELRQVRPALKDATDTLRDVSMVFRKGMRAKNLIEHARSTAHEATTAEVVDMFSSNLMASISSSMANQATHRDVTLAEHALEDFSWYMESFNETLQTKIGSVPSDSLDTSVDAGMAILGIDGPDINSALNAISLLQIAGECSDAAKGLQPILNRLGEMVDSAAATHRELKIKEDDLLFPHRQEVLKTLPPELTQLEPALFQPLSERLPAPTRKTRLTA